jgi:phosphoglycerol transferase MdoB-like AlkP superfamily enzyme
MWVPVAVIGYQLSFGLWEADDKNMAASIQPVVNSILPTPIIALHKSAYELRLYQATLDDRQIDADELRSDLALIDPSVDSNFIDDYTIRRTLTPALAARSPDHIFVLIMERYDQWPMLQNYAELNLTTALSAIADNGLESTRFLPGDRNTMGSVSVIVTGMPYVGLEMRHYLDETLESSIATIFKREGYRTRFFYGGGLAWQNIGQFALRYGFDEALGAEHLGGRYIERNPWGVDDGSLFDFVARTINENPDQSSLNVILSTSNHPPFSLDLYGHGVPIQAIRRAVQAYAPEHVSVELAARRLAHLWYSDRELGRFVTEMTDSNPNSLFAITGDHYGRGHIVAQPNPEEANYVPFVVYGPQILDGVELDPGVPGGHIDIAATLIDLVMPQDFEYASLGTSLFEKSEDAFGFGSQIITTNKSIAPIDTENPAFEPWQRRVDAMENISWWRLQRGNAVSPRREQLSSLDQQK